MSEELDNDTNVSEDEQSTAESSNESGNVETITSEENTEEKQESESPEPVEEEQITMTRSQRDAEAAKIRQIAQRKAKREAQRELEERYQQNSGTQTVNQPQQQNIPQAPDANSFWDENTQKWVPGNMTMAEYANLVAQQPQAVKQQIQTQSSVDSQNIQQNQPITASFSKGAEDQADECMVHIPDFEQTMKGAPVSPDMVNSACVDREGLKNLYQLMKDSPHELYQISQLPPHEQQHRMWLMNQKSSAKRAKKVQTKATPQPAPLDTNGNLNKKWSEMSYKEKQAARQREIWGN